MGVAVLNPQDCLKQNFPHMKYPRNPTSCPNRQKKPVTNRTRRSPPRNQASRSPPVAPPLPPHRATFSAFVSKGTAKKSPNNGVVAGQFRLLKRGEAIPKKTSDLVVEAIPKKASDLVVEAIPKKASDLIVEAIHKETSDLIVEAIADLVVEKPDLGSTRRIGPAPDMIPSQIRFSSRKSKKAPLYAGPVTMTSPPPSDVPLPARIFNTKTTNDLTNGLIKLLCLDIA
ncbi:unnamed protein product [Microthlaspi erraticum]|uniref:Uncharacterized protein n=1 Tax=Microthlaspi erraticum TaxID=1685480 RepID=A0A6D2JZH3_9BRAS|nr:unnamed protein product [Microthlaspi erraticum]